MATITQIQINHSVDNWPTKPSKMAREQTAEIARYLKALTSGARGGTALIQRGHAVAGTGIVTCASVAAADTVTVNGVVFTAVASGATGNQFNVGSDTITAANLAAAINASATAKVAGMVSASSAAGVVTITMLQPGVAGLLGTLTSSNGARLAVTASPFQNAANDTLVTYTLG